MFRNENFLGFLHPYNLLEYFQNNEIDSNKTLQKRQYTNGSIKEQQFFKRGSNKLYCSNREKKEGTSMLPILSWKPKIIPSRGRSMIVTSRKLELFHQYVMTSWHYVVTKSSITDDGRVQDLLLLCLFSVQNITRNIKIKGSRHLHVQSQKEEHECKV